MISITDENFIASGAYCVCYRHPNIPDQCIKIQTSNKKARKRLETDIAYYKKLHKDRSDLRHVANFLGTCKTNLGQGYVYQCILDDDGEVSKTLEYHLKSSNLEPEVLLKELRPLANHILNNRILISDIHPRNILMQCAEGQAPKAVIVDGLGDKVTITVLNSFASVTHTKIIRRWNRFIDLLVHRYPDFLPNIEELYLSKKNITAT